MRTPRSCLVAGAVAFLTCGFAQPANAAFVGPITPYLSFSGDSPFAGVDFSGGFFFLEDFEDHLLNTPGVSALAGNVTSGSASFPIIDSVDEDDGAVDGQCRVGVVSCDGFFNVSGSLGLTFVFDAVALGTLPTHAGIVWVDGTTGTAPLSLEVFDAGGTSLGVFIGGDVAGVLDTDLEVEEDTFVGFINPGGISQIIVRSGGTTGIEVDHLQYGNRGIDSVPEPTTLALLGLGLAGLGFARRRPH